MDAVEAKRLVKVGKELITAQKMLSESTLLRIVDEEVRDKALIGEHTLSTNLTYLHLFYNLDKLKGGYKLEPELKKLIVAHYEEKGYKAKFRLFSLTLILDWRE